MRRQRPLDGDYQVKVAETENMILWQDWEPPGGGRRGLFPPLWMAWAVLLLAWLGPPLLAALGLLWVAWG
jgi:hypothetical protein